MKETPSLNFRRVNYNVEIVTPSSGISHILARTTKGPFNTPSRVISSVTQFREIFGKEIVPDNSVSNIERALNLGSKVRVVRVSGEVPSTKGVAKTYDAETGVGGLDPVVLVLVMTNPLDSSQTISVNLNLVTKEPGASIINPELPGNDSEFYLKLSKLVNGPVTSYYLEQYKTITDNIIAGQPDYTDNLLGRNNVLRSSDGTNANPFIDADVFQNFYYNTPNVEFEVKSITTDIAGLSGTILTVEDLIAFMRGHRNWKASITMATSNVYYVINEGTPDGDSTSDTWIDAYRAIEGNTDGYQLICSHIHQHIPLEYETTYQAIAQAINLNKEVMLFVEVPKLDTDGFLDYNALLAKVKTMAAAIGYYPFVAYFGGGIKFYDNNAALRSNDILGTVLGLADATSSNSGPWASFSGMNRGLINDGHGNTLKNSPELSYEQLNQLAQEGLNLFIVRDTPTAGRRTLLWHNFTSSLENNSDRFISSIRAFLYMKKQIRPILQKYIEEPNTFGTWKNIYYEVVTILDPLIGQVFTEYSWKGDQFATSYNDLQVNSESEVRQGKYRVQLSYKDIVTLQQIDIEFSIDRSNSQITINS